MLEIRTTCECCLKELPNGSPEAMICTFECTFCKSCVEGELQNVCPNCGGGFTPRPKRPEEWMEKYPVKGKVDFKPFSKERHQKRLDKYLGIDPSER